MKTKISVIVPSLNSAEYIEECMNSVLEQTLNDIEIICVDAGSTDGTFEILQQYAMQDSRIKLLHSDKKSYGYQMNMGMDVATGEYLSIVETDDWIEANMYEILWKTANTNDVDMVKSNYYHFTTTPQIKNLPFENLASCLYNHVFHPLDQRAIFTTAPAIWSGIYRRELLLSNHVRFNETPGASYQDTSFHFIVCTIAKSCYLLNTYFYHYRRDNNNSSVNSKKKVFCVSDEIHYYESFLAARPIYKEKIETYFMALKYEKYRWNYVRLAPQFQWGFLNLMYNEFSQAEASNLLRKEQFSISTWQGIQSILNSPVRYFQDTCKIYSTRPVLSDVCPYTVLRKAVNASPKISVIIPTYNYAQYVGKTIESVLSQTLKDIEIICVNDGSTDGSLNILLEYANRDNRITVLTQINKGQSASRNAGLSVARGEYIYFLDSDDFLVQDSLEYLEKIATNRMLDILYFNGESFFEPQGLEKKYPYYKTAYEYTAELPDILLGKELFCRMVKDKKYRVSSCLAIYRREYLNTINLRFIEGILHEDIFFTFESMIRAERVAHTKGKYLLRRVHMDSVMTKPKSFLHVYGYLSNILYMLRFIASLPYETELHHYMATELNVMMNLLKSTYIALPDKNACRSKLNAVELLFLDNIVMKATVIPIKNNTNEAELIRASMSYKIGRIITWIPRKIRGGIRCYKEHGLRYTWGRVLTHLQIAAN